MSDPFWLRQRDAISVRVIGLGEGVVSGPVYSSDFVQIPGVPQKPETPEINQIGARIFIDWSEVGYHGTGAGEYLSYSL